MLIFIIICVKTPTLSLIQFARHLREFVTIWQMTRPNSVYEGVPNPDKEVIIHLFFN